MLSFSFPRTRLRRCRQAAWIRSLVAETTLKPTDFIQPFFVVEGERVEDPITSLPGIERLSCDVLVERAQQVFHVGIPGIILFPALSVERKTTHAREAYNPDNLICRTIRAVKRLLPDLGVFADVALDPYTSHGHDGLVYKDVILNDETVDVLIKQALVLADSGVDVLAPSDMMDGRIGRLRDALDHAGYKDTLLCSYAVKYASSFYGPFRDAVYTKAVLQGDKRTYQMDPANTEEALREVHLDIAEGADIVMVKPGLPSLDIIHRVKQTFGVPTFAYQVSGEYAMIKAASTQGWLDGQKCLIESLLCLKRAGADAILTYAAYEIAKILNTTSHALR